SLDVDRILQLALAALGDQEGEMDQRIAPLQTLADLRVAHVGADLAQLGRDDQRRPQVDGDDLLDGSLLGQPAQYQCPELPAPPGNRDAHGKVTTRKRSKRTAETRSTQRFSFQKQGQLRALRVSAVRRKPSHDV